MKNILIVFITVMLMLSLWGCKAAPVPETEPVCTAAELKNTYKVCDLREFFLHRHMNVRLSELPEGETVKRVLYYPEVNEKFPVEVVEGNEHTRYTVYQTQEGGYYYVFWTHAWPLNLQERPYTDDYMCVWYSCYLQDGGNIDVYRIKPGVTTMRDVLEMDPYAEEVVLSRGIYTYSVLDPKTLLQVRYTYGKNASDGASYYDSMVVKEVTAVKIGESASKLEDVSPCYLPQ